MEHHSIDLEAWRLLPWLANNTLDGEELERILDHLKHSPRCREELLFLSELRHAVEASAGDSCDIPEERLASLMDRIDAQERARSVSPAGGTATLRWLAQAALVVLLTGALWWLVGDGESRDEPLQSPQFQTLSSDEPSSGSADRPGDVERPRLRLVPESGLAEADLRRLVLDLDAEIVAGPTAMGVYTLGWKAGRPTRSVEWLDDVAAGLRSDARVAFAEPVRGP